MVSSQERLLRGELTLQWAMAAEGEDIKHLVMSETQR